MLSKLIVILGILALCIGLSFLSNAEAFQNRIEGFWNVDQAFRNGKETNTLQNAYFNFKEGDSVEFDLTGELEVAKYQVVSKYHHKLFGDPTIIINETLMGATYIVESISDTTMTILGSIQNNEFKFVLRQAN